MLSELITDVMSEFPSPFFRRLGIVFVSHKRLLERIKARLCRKGILPTSDGAKLDEHHRRIIDLYKGDAARALWLIDAYAIRNRELFRGLADKILEALVAPGIIMSILIVIFCMILIWLL